jgi:hypothetical protein
MLAASTKGFQAEGKNEGKLIRVDALHPHNHRKLKIIDNK